MKKSWPISKHWAVLSLLMLTELYRNVIPVGFSTPSLGGRVSSMFLQGAGIRYSGSKRSNSWLIRTVRELNCLNSPVPFLLMQAVPNMSLGKNSKLVLSSGWKSTQMWRAKTSCRYPPFGNSSFTLLTEAQRSTHASDPHVSRQSLLVSRNYLQHSPKTKVCHSKKFHMWKIQFQNFFLPSLSTLCLYFSF